MGRRSCSEVDFNRGVNIKWQMAAGGLMALARAAAKLVESLINLQRIFTEFGQHGLWYHLKRRVVIVNNKIGWEFHGCVCTATARMCSEEGLVGIMVVAQ